MFDLLRSTIEWQNWGWNILTVSFVATIFLTLLHMWGVSKQREAIWIGKSGESVSVKLFSFMCALFVVFFIYGVIKHSAAMIANSLLFFSYLPAVIGLWKFKGFTKLEKWLAVVFLMMILAILILPWKDIIFMIIVLGGVLPVATQTFEIWKEGKAGALNIRFVFVFLLASVFWAIYGFAIHSLTLKLASSLGTFFLIITILLWHKYRKLERVSLG